MQKKWLYFFVIVCSLAGSAWVAWNRVNYVPTDPHTGINMCLFRAATGLPCPSCGTTRSVLDITRLDFADALHTNPVGFIIAFVIIIFPFWVLYDLSANKSTFYNFYITAEATIRKRWVTISLVLLVAANWIWNIYKFTS